MTERESARGKEIDERKGDKTCQTRSPPFATGYSEGKGEKRDSESRKQTTDRNDLGTHREKRRKTHRPLCISCASFRVCLFFLLPGCSLSPIKLDTAETECKKSLEKDLFSQFTRMCVPTVHSSNFVPVTCPSVTFEYDLSAWQHSRRCILCIPTYYQ